jgi:hypothetical protein
MNKIGRSIDNEMILLGATDNPVRVIRRQEMIKTSNNRWNHQEKTRTPIFD